MLVASHGLNLRIDVREEVDPLSDLVSGRFLDIVIVGPGVSVILTSFELDEAQRVRYAEDPALMIAFAVGKIKISLR